MFIKRERKENEARLPADILLNKRVIMKTVACHTIQGVLIPSPDVSYDSQLIKKLKIN